MCFIIKHGLLYFCINSQYLYVIIQKKTHVNKRNYRGNTALHVATRRKQTEVINVLLNYGADPRIANKQDQLAQHLTEVRRLFEFSCDTKIFYNQLLQVKQWNMHIFFSLQDSSIQSTLLSVSLKLATAQMNFMDEETKKTSVEKGS